MQKKKIAIVTGANSGLGFETTVGLVEAHYTVVMACRNPEKANVAKDKIKQYYPNANLQVMPLDLSSLNSVRLFVECFKSQYTHLNVIINNAGVLCYSTQKTIDGFELQFSVNYLGHFLLTALLMDIIPNTVDSRIVSISSITHKKARIDFDNIQLTQSAHNKAYGQSKLACLMFASELNRRLQAVDKKIVSVSAHPGGTATNIFKSMPTIKYHLLKLISPLIAHDNAKAAKTSLFAALDKTVIGGDFIGPQGFLDIKGPPGPAKRSLYSLNPDIARKLWELSEKLVQERFPL